MDKRIIFIIGGARSGKSRFALEQAGSLAGEKAYIATAQVFDDEMQARVEQHKRERSGEWRTFEEPVWLPTALRQLSCTYPVILVDCLTLWLSNLMLGMEDSPEKHFDNLIQSFKDCHPSRIYLVSNEVGMGIVPENALARKFRDYAGRLNQMTAAAADEVYLMAAGLALRIK